MNAQNALQFLAHRATEPPAKFRNVDNVRGNRRLTAGLVLAEMGWVHPVGLVEVVGGF